MLRMSGLVFDDIIQGTDPVYTDPAWNQKMSVGDVASLAFVASQSTASATLSFSKTETTSPPQTLSFSYLYNAGLDALSTLDSACAAQYPDSPSSQALYCKEDYTRE